MGRQRWKRRRFTPRSRGRTTRKREMNEMIKKAAVVVVLLSSAGPVAGQERTVLARFEGAIGVDPVANAAGTPNADGTLPNVRLNVVRGVSPASRWTIAGLRADVYADGHIRVR